jgi:hypothetical protein
VSVTFAQHQFRITGAARLLKQACAQARAEAARRGVNVAVAFSGDEQDPEIRLVLDGNDNGIRAADVDSGADPELRSLGRLGDHFRGVRFAVPWDCPGIDGSPGVAAGSDPLRFGAAGLLVFTPAGTASGGTAYLSGHAGAMLAVRVLAATGRVRLLSCTQSTRRWGEM